MSIGKINAEERARFLSSVNRQYKAKEILIKTMDKLAEEIPGITAGEVTSCLLTLALHYVDQANLKERETCRISSCESSCDCEEGYICEKGICIKKKK